MSDQTKPADPAGQAEQRGTSPEDVVRHLLDLLLRAENRRDMDPIADLWAVDGTAEFPFAVGDAPTRLDGREAVREYLAPYPEIYDVTDVTDLVIHHTADRSTVIVEFGSYGRTVATGDPYEMRYVAIVTVRDGAITSYRDYWSPVQVARASGNLAGLVEALRRESDERPGRVSG